MDSGRVTVDFQLLFESAPGLYLVLTPDLTIVAVSDAYLRATMTKREEILGRPLFEVFPDNPNDLTASGVNNLRASLEHVIQAREPDAMAVQKYGIRLPETSGGGFEERFWSPVNTPVLNPSGELVYIIHRVEDVSEFVRLKQLDSEHDKVTEQLRDQAQLMEAEVYRRAQQVSEANRQLSKANAELESLYQKTRELDQIKSEFFANISHELRTPLSLIIGPIEVLISTYDVSHKVRHQLAMILRNAHLLLDQVNDLLDAAKLDSGKMALAYVELDAAQWIRTLAAHFQSLAHDRHISYSVEANGCPPAQIDPEKLQRVFLNLLSNAFKFTPTGGSIRCTLKCDGELIVYEIADSGPGIPPEAREAVFERFCQLDGGTARRYGGTGLGLSIARDFVELHEGKITAGDAPEGGALFTVTLPLKAPPGVVISSEFVSPSLPTVSAPSLPHEPDLYPVIQKEDDHRPLVLVVEDNVDLNQFIRDSLSRKYRTDYALNGAEGLEKVLALKPDLVLSDVMMPGLGGLGLLREIRWNGNTRTIPVILLSARAGEESAVEGLESGADDYLVKPFSSRELLARVRAHLEMSSIRRSLEVELEQRVTERTVQLASKNEQLQGMTQQLWQTSKLATVGELAASIAHELNNPLATVSLRTEQLLSTVNGQGRDSIEIILNEIERMAELVKNLLEFSRRNNAQVSTLDIRSEIVNSVEFIRYYLRKRNVEVINDFADRVPLILADRQQLRQLFLNLLTNASDAMPIGGKLTIQVRESELADLPAVQINFIDSGEGISAETLERIWEPFYTTKAEGKGTGLGMAICHRVVDEHKGTIKIESELGRGTTISMVFPSSERVEVNAEDGDGNLETQSYLCQ
jgi:signal transduction histidine kinase